MPCYRPSWDHQLQPGTPDYLTARSRVDVRRKLTYHIIDYYLDLCGFCLPMPEAGDAEALGVWRRLVEDITRAPPEDVGTASIAQYRTAAFLITNHLRCDGVTFEDLLDQQSLTELTDPQELGYGWIIRWCVYMMTGRFRREGWSIQLAPSERA